MDLNDYDRVVEVRKHDKTEWYKKFLEYSTNNVDFIGKLAEKGKRCFICQKDNKTILMNSNGEEELIDYIDLDEFIEVEVNDYIYRKYSVLK